MTFSGQAAFWRLAGALSSPCYVEVSQGFAADQAGGPSVHDAGFRSVTGPACALVRSVVNTHA